MKSSYAVILVIVCIVVTIAGWNSMMNIVDNPPPKLTHLQQLSVDHGYVRAPANPWTLPVAEFLGGLAGIIYGAYSFIGNARPRRTPKPSGG